MFKKLVFALVLLTALWSARLPAAVSAYAFGDFYYMKNHNSSFNDQNGFWLRRVYLWYDRDISDKFKARIRLEMNSDGKFASADTIKAFIKDAYVSYQYLPLHAFTLGIQESLAFGNTEKFWGYRSVEKTVLDLFKVRDSRDFGLTMNGSFDKDKKFSYAVMVGNNSSYKWENNKQKGYYARFTYTPTSHWLVEVYADWLGITNIKHTTMLQGFAGFKSDSGRLGVNYSLERIHELGKPDTDTNIYSVLGALKLAKKLEAFARYDHIPNPTPWAQDTYVFTVTGFRTDMLIAGLAWNIHPKVMIAPNVEMVHFGTDKNGVAGPANDYYYRVTFYYQF